MMSKEAPSARCFDFAQILAADSCFARVVVLKFEQSGCALVCLFF